MDFNEGRPVWHASIAAVHPKLGRVFPVVAASMSTRALMGEVAKDLLCGVGRIPSTLEQGGLCLHYRRSLTDDELALLSPAWCAINPDSMAGRGIVLERDT